MKQAFTWHNITKSFDCMWPPSLTTSPFANLKFFKGKTIQQRLDFEDNEFEQGVAAATEHGFVPEDIMDNLLGESKEGAQRRNEYKATHKQRSQIFNHAASQLRRKNVEAEKEKEKKAAEGKKQLVGEWEAFKKEIEQK